MSNKPNIPNSTTYYISVEFPKAYVRHYNLKVFLQAIIRQIFQAIRLQQSIPNKLFKPIAPLSNHIFKENPDIPHYLRQANQGRKSAYYGIMMLHSDTPLLMTHTTSGIDMEQLTFKNLQAIFLPRASQNLLPKELPVTPYLASDNYDYLYIKIPNVEDLLQETSQVVTDEFLRKRLC